MIEQLLKDNFSGKELDIYEASLNQFSKYGINKVTVNELCQAANVSKMTFYKYFKNKQELALAFIKLFFEEIKEKSLKVLENEDIDTRTRFSMITIDEQNAIKELGNEFMSSILTLPEAQEYFEEYRNDSWLMLKDFIEKKQAVGELNHKFKPELLKLIISKIWEIIASQEINLLYSSVDEMLIDIEEVLFMGILSRDEESHHERID